MTAYRARIAHAHLRVRDLGRSVEFYTRFLGLAITEEIPGAFAFLSAGPAHHELALEAVGPDAPLPFADSAGLSHVAFEVPDRRSFAQAYNTIMKGGVRAAAVDHGISWSLYFTDPDGNGVEITWDTRGEPDGTARWSGRSLPLGAVRILSSL